MHMCVMWAVQQNLSLFPFPPKKFNFFFCIYLDFSFVCLFVLHLSIYSLFKKVDMLVERYTAEPELNLITQRKAHGLRCLNLTLLDDSLSPVKTKCFCSSKF